MKESSQERELYFKCPRCNSLFSAAKDVLEQDRQIKAYLTSPFLGGKLTPLGNLPKCAKCSSRLERISREEFDREMEKTPESNTQR